jgi:hypothetical protein
MGKSGTERIIGAEEIFDAEAWKVVGRADKGLSNPWNIVRLAQSRCQQGGI